LVVKPALGYLHGKHFTQGLKLVGAFRLNRSSDAASAFELISQTEKDVVKHLVLVKDWILHRASVH
jgi:hypothetical protein